MSRRVPMLLALALAKILLGCGASSATSAGPRATVEPTEEAAAPIAQCASWDPEADPTSAPPDVAAPPEGARNGGGGLRFCVLREGDGDVRPRRESRVRVHYTGWTTDGEMFDSSRPRGEPTTFGVSEVIRGWTEALTHMRVGEIRRVWIPEDLAYRGQAGAPAGMLVFDIELLEIVE